MTYDFPRNPTNLLASIHTFLLELPLKAIIFFHTQIDIFIKERLKKKDCIQYLINWSKRYDHQI